MFIDFLFRSVQMPGEETAFAIMERRWKMRVDHLPKTLELLLCLIELFLALDTQKSCIEDGSLSLSLSHNIYI